jgi:YfiH family protein
MPETRVAGQVPRFELPEWKTRFGVLAGITGRGEEPPAFDLGLGGHAAPVGAVLGRWRAFGASVPAFQGTVLARQVHGTTVLWHDTAAGLVIRDNADGHATATRGLLLTVTVADCIPVYIVDPSRRTVALLHAGWRGTAAGILGRGMDLLEAHGSSPKDLVVHCGIGICARCYEVGPEVFEGCGLAVPPGGKGTLDLRGLLAAAARERGVAEVSVSPYCSAHDRNGFFSHRASSGKDGRMVAYLGLLP